MATDAEDELRSIERLLDERVGKDEGGDERSVFERVEDVVDAFDAWCDLAIRRLHELHSVQGQECDFCEKYLGGNSG